MNTERFALTVGISGVATLLLMFVLQSCYGEEDKGSLPTAEMGEIKRVYQFDKWGGKVKSPNRRIEKLEIDPNFFDAISKKTTVFTPKAKRARELSLKMVDKGSGLDAKVDIFVTNGPLGAHTKIINFLSVVAAPAPALRRVDPNDPNDPLNVGDVCFVAAYRPTPEKNKKPVIRILLFCRNNVFVALRNSDDRTKESYPDLGQIARLLDRRLKGISKPIPQGDGQGRAKDGASH